MKIIKYRFATIFVIFVFIYYLSKLFLNTNKIPIYTPLESTDNWYRTLQENKQYYSSKKYSKEIPKKIWTFWHSNKIPKLVQDCLSTWSKSNPDYDITVLSRKSLSKYISIRFPKNFEDGSTMNQYHADWVRLAILMEHGGVWVDSSTLITQSVSFIHKQIEKDGTDAFMFSMPDYTTDPSFPYYENWFIASAPKSQIISLWFQEFSIAYEQFGLQDSYLDFLKITYGEVQYQNFIQKNNAPGYLKQHVILQRVLQIDNIPLPSSKNATDPFYGPLYIMSTVGYEPWKYMDKILIEPWTDSTTPCIVKIRGFDRTIGEFYFGVLSSFSIFEHNWRFWKIKKLPSQKSLFYKSLQGKFS